MNFVFLTVEDALDIHSMQLRDMVAERASETGVYWNPQWYNRR